MPTPRYGIAPRLYQLLALAALALVPQLAAARPLTVLAFGDSLTAGYQLGPGEGFAPQLETALKARGRDVRVVGAGVSGDTSAQGRARVNWVLAGLKAPADLVIVELGANDMLRGQSPAAARANLDAIVKAFKARGARVLLAGMRAAPNLGARYGQAFDAIYADVARANGVARYPFFLDGVAAQPKLQLGDGMHPNAAGVKIIVRRILPAVEAELGKRG
ncbi:acyl-CoA thioesterase [alpha proteobacterium AAP81b]|nr:acyl-CoA thioesterase [alpha proteobacterium AAP81b]